VTKRNTQALKAIRVKYDSRNYSQGIGYHIPNGMTLKEWQTLKRTWENKLLKSGHDEIEQFSSNSTGHFSPYFVKTKHNNSLSGSSATVARLYKPDTQEYYRRLGIFFYHAPLQKIFKGNYWMYYHIIRLRKDGATYQNLVDWMRTKAPKSFRAKKSIFWAFYHVNYLQDEMQKWFNANPEFKE
jgi:hypothetical protein